ncbi:MAG: tyrosine-type recombinase/integrase [Coriobacteriia bacterium]|nr:tyrosine-type recombinase/integrase [Coriobacteriia bacterium]
MADDTGLRQRDNGTWQVRVVYRDMSGRVRELTATAPTKTEARRTRDALREQRNNGQALGTGRESLEAYLTTWLERREKRGGRDGKPLSPLTLEAYRRNIEHYIVPIIGGVQLQKLRAEHIERFLDQIAHRKNTRTGEPLSGQTQQHAFRVLHKALEDAFKQERIIVNPCRLVDGPRPERHEAAVLGASDVAKLLTSLRTEGPDWLYMAALLAVTTGLRRGEVLALMWSDVDLEGGHANIVQERVAAAGGAILKPPKSAASMSDVALPAYTVAELRSYAVRQKARRLASGELWQGENVVIDNGIGASVSPSHLSRCFTKAAKAAGLEVTFHGLRHTFASLHHAAGTPLKVMQGALRHASPDLVVQRYTHSLPGADAEAAERLDAMLREAL